MRRFFQEFPREGYIWSAALLYLAIVLPNNDFDLTVCPFALTGLDWCPGCGLGHAIGAMLHGNLVKSLQFHVLGPLATFTLAGRIIFLGVHVRKNRSLQQKADKHAQHCNTSS